MKSVVIYTTNVWDVNEVKSHPETLFVYGDNDMHIGYDEQSVIRNEPNAFGIPTKKRPDTKSDAFYTDDQFEMNADRFNDILIKLINTFVKSEYTTLAFPSDLAIGHSQMSLRAPRTYEYIYNLLIEFLKCSKNIPIV